MDKWLITFRSVTYAQKAERALRKAEISCQLRRTPRTLSERGCSYCLSVPSAQAMLAVQLLQEQEIAYEKTYALVGRGKVEERVL